MSEPMTDGNLVRVVEAPCLEGDCEDEPAEGEWCSHTRLMPASQVPGDVEMLGDTTDV